jgi:hypothetical protein
MHLTVKLATGRDFHAIDSESCIGRRIVRLTANHAIDGESFDVAVNRAIVRLGGESGN